MLKRCLIWGILTITLLLTPFTQALAEGNGEGATSLMDGPFVILAFATLIIMIYYSIRD